MLTLIAIMSVAMIILGIGIYVWRIKPSADNRKVFLSLAVIITVWMILNYFSKTVTDPGLFLLLVRLVMAVTCWLPTALYLFSLCFPRGEINLTRAQWWWLGGGTLFITLLNLTNFVFPDFTYVDGELSPVPGFGIAFYGLHMFVLVALVCRNFWHKSKIARGLEKVRLTYFTFAFALAMFFALLFNFVLPAFFQNSDWMSVGIMAMGLAFIGATGYTMIKTTFAGIDLVIADIIYYTVILLLLIIPVLTYYYVPQTDNLWLGLATLAIYLIWLTAFVYLYNHLENFLIKKIVNHGADWRVEKESFLRRIDEMLDQDNINHETLKFFNMLIKNSGCLIMGDFLDSGELTLWGSLPEKPTNKIMMLSTSAWPQKKYTPLIYDQLEHRGEPEALIHEMKKLQVGAIFPLTFYEELKGIILFGEKLNGNPYFIQDIELIESTLKEVTPLLNKAAIHQNTEDFNKHLQRRVEHATRRLRKMNEELVQADKLKDEFVSVASHELRTPMTAIKGYLWMVAKNNTPEKLETNQKYIEIALNSTERLISLVNDMLTISRIEGGRYALTLETMDLRGLVRQVQSELQPIADNKDIYLTMKAPREKCNVYIDNKKIAEVLHNIIGNALKFTSVGGVTLTLRSDPKFIYVDVTDTGVGIDEADFAKLFSKFARMEKSYVKIKETGTGLGLYISRQIMQMHHGEITFVSRLGQGSTFTLQFPRAK